MRAGVVALANRSRTLYGEVITVERTARYRSLLDGNLVFTVKTYRVNFYTIDRIYVNVVGCREVGILFVSNGYGVLARSVLIVIARYVVVGIEQRVFSAVGLIERNG